MAINSIKALIGKISGTSAVMSVLMSDENIKERLKKFFFAFSLFSFYQRSLRFPQSFENIRIYRSTGESVEPI